MQRRSGQTLNTPGKPREEVESLLPLTLGFEVNRTAASCNALLSAADRALYATKEAGRNVVVIDSPTIDVAYQIKKRNAQK
jgi:GGDEF domain-containing protein